MGELVSAWGFNAGEVWPSLTLPSDWRRNLCNRGRKIGHQSVTSPMFYLFIPIMWATSRMALFTSCCCNSWGTINLHWQHQLYLSVPISVYPWVFTSIPYSITSSKSFTFWSNGIRSQSRSDVYDPWILLPYFSKFLVSYTFPIILSKFHVLWSQLPSEVEDSTDLHPSWLNSNKLFSSWF